MEDKDAIAYVADMARQLADLIRTPLPTLALLLDLVADVARAAIPKG